MSTTKLFLSKSELALQYLPDLAPHSAVNRFMAWVKFNKALFAALLATGYRTTQKQFTRQQVQLIYDYLGEP